MKGWLYIEALDISYPVVQERTTMRIFIRRMRERATLRVPFSSITRIRMISVTGNTIVYGHNMKNLSMFGKLKQMKEQEKYQGQRLFLDADANQTMCTRFFLLSIPRQTVMSTHCIPAEAKRLYSI